MNSVRNEKAFVQLCVGFKVFNQFWRMISNQRVLIRLILMITEILFNDKIWNPFLVLKFWTNTSQTKYLNRYLSWRKDRH